MSELGPFYPTPTGELQKNQHAWNQIANIVFLESPAFVGWSYSNTTTDIVVGTDVLRLRIQPKYLCKMLMLTRCSKVIVFKAFMPRMTACDAVT